MKHEIDDRTWKKLAPLIEAVRPVGKTDPVDLRRTIEGIVWRLRNGAKWRSVPERFGPWHRVFQLFNRWSKAGTWEALHELALERGVSLGMVHLDGTTIRAHAKAAGAEKGGTRPTRSAAPAAATARRSA